MIHGSATFDAMQKKMKPNWIYLYISSFLLIAGSTIYLLFRQNVIFLSWLDSDLLNNIHIDTNSDNMCMYFVLYCLPDSLWYAALLTIQLVFDDNIEIKTFGIIATTPFVLEIMQYADLMAGTFDWYDLITYLLTLLLFILCAKKHFIRSHH